MFRNSSYDFDALPKEFADRPSSERNVAEGGGRFDERNGAAKRISADERMAWGGESNATATATAPNTASDSEHTPGQTAMAVDEESIPNMPLNQSNSPPLGNSHPYLQGKARSSEASITWEEPRTRQYFTPQTIESYDASKETHYVFVIHGTFDSPPKGFLPTPWYWLEKENPNNFCQILSADLKPSPLGASAVWRELSPGIKLPQDCPYPFFWDGTNTHGARITAGKMLANLINSTAKADPSARIHLVAHSHGGNVVLKAISKYLTILRRESSISYNDRITGDFWEANAESYRDIARHQRVEGLSFWVWLLSPFVVVKRPWAADPELGLFPWAKWTVTDTLLGLPKTRQAKFLRKKWAGSSNTNALGNIVFMGTPFYSKYWQGGAVWAMGSNILVTTAMVFCMIVGAYAAMQVVITHRPSSANISGLQLTFWLATALAAFLVVVYNTVREKRYANGNLYFTEKKAWSPAMSALVLNAGKLDEAALALSTEPLVRAYLMPQLKAMLTPDPWRNLKAVPGRSLLQTAAHAYNNLWLLFWNIVLAVPYLILSLLNYFLVPYLSNMLLRLFITLGFGLQKGELDYARVFVEEYLRLPPETHRVVHWNVQKILTTCASPSSALEDDIDLLKSQPGYIPDPLPSPGGAAKRSFEDFSKRWKFLWDEAELERKASESITLRLLKDEMKHMEFNPRTTRVAFEKELKVICVTLEERFKDMTGNVELSHGSYFRNKAVISAVGHFLVHGELPHWAPRLGDMVPPLECHRPRRAAAAFESLKEKLTKHK